MIDKSLLPYLYYFWQVAKCGSFTRAAHRLNVGQSAVSYQVKLLEEKMMNHAQNLEFEEAATTRDKIAKLREKQLAT